MDSTEFLNHPIFTYTGKEKEFEELNQPFNKTTESKETIGNEKTASDGGEVFKAIRDIYQKKITEVELIKDTYDNMKQSILTKWGMEFLVQYETLMIIILKKAQIKNDLILNTFSKKKNVFEVDKFEEFLEYPNEYLDLKLELENIKEELKNIDKEIYQTIMKDCENQEFLEEINDNLY